MIYIFNRLTTSGNVFESRAKFVHKRQSSFAAELFILFHRILFRASALSCHFFAYFSPALRFISFSRRNKTDALQLWSLYEVSSLALATAVKRLTARLKPSDSKVKRIKQPPNERINRTKLCEWLRSCCFLYNVKIRSFPKTLNANCNKVAFFRGI